MRTDLRNPLNEGVNNLLTWRNRYSLIEYPEKVTINIFYRKYTIEFMFPDIIGCFEKNIFGNAKAKWSTFEEGYKILKNTYGVTATSKTQPVLLNLIQQKQRNVGNTNYGIFDPLIQNVQKGNHSKLEEIEYSYLYYLLTDESILLWGAFGGTGLSKMDAIGKMTGLMLETVDIISYGQIEQILGQFCAAAYLKENYKPLPPNVK